MTANERFDQLLPPDPGVGRVEPLPPNLAAGSVPTDLPRHLNARLGEPALQGQRSEQTAGLVGAAVEWGLSDSQILAMALEHPPTQSKYGKRTGTEVARLLGKYRPSHTHIGLPCDKAGCPNQPRWMRKTSPYPTPRRPRGSANGSPPPAGKTIGALFEQLRGYQHLDDPNLVWFVLAVAVSAELDGEPLWGMPVGPSSGGKTETIRLLDSSAWTIDELTAASLLGWIGGKPGKPGHPGGVLARIGNGNKGLITVGDMSTIISTSERGGRDQLFSALRRIYDGSYDRTIGTAPEPLHWHGRITMVAGCTSAIDRYASHNDHLGPRWLYYRLPERTAKSDKQLARAAQRNPNIDEQRATAQTITASIVGAAANRAAAINIPAFILDRIIDVAMVVCLGRAGVPRHGYGKREIDGVPNIERPPRVTKQLTMLARCLLALGLDEKRTLWLVEHAGLSSMPEIRRMALTELAGGEELAGNEIARRIGMHRHPTRFALEELQAIGVTDRDEEDDEDGGFPQSRPWRLAGGDADLIVDVVGAHPWHEIEETIPQTPPERGNDQQKQMVSSTSCQGNDEPPPISDADAPKEDTYG